MCSTFFCELVINCLTDFPKVSLHKLSEHVFIAPFLCISVNSHVTLVLGTQVTIKRGIGASC